MKAYMQYRIVNCKLLWKPSTSLHFRKDFGPYIPRWNWVERLLEMINPLLYRTKR